MKKAIITGITGQDGTYLAELLLKKGYEVHGIRRKTSIYNTQRIDHLLEDSHQANRKLHLHYGDLSDGGNLTSIIQKIEPDEIYNLGAMSHVHVSFQMPEYTADVDAIGVLRILEAIKNLGLINKTKIYQASTSELYGKVLEIPQSENTPFYPRSPYAIAKLYAYWTIINYREAYDIFACNGILFNHESPIRGENFVTRKITRAAVRIAMGIQDKLYLGNLDSKRDWGHAKDYVEGMYLMLQQNEPDDYVLATGITTTIREFVIIAFSKLGISIKFEGSNENEKGIVISNDGRYNVKVGSTIVLVDPKYYRPTEVDILIGDASKAKSKLNWIPHYSLDMIIEEMINSDLNSLNQLNIN